MPGFYFYTSNDQLSLVKALGEVLKEKPLSQVFEPELMVIQSLGMKRWISLHLAEQLGILAHTRFLFPNQLLSDVFEQVVPEFQKEDLFDRETACWKILDILPKMPDNLLFEDLKNYLYENGKFRQIKAYQLALKIAYLFRPVIGEVVRSYLKCGDLKQGFARVRCNHCGYEFLLQFSCKTRRICPSCQAKRAVLFGPPSSVCFQSSHHA